MTTEETLEKIDRLLQPQIIGAGRFDMCRPPDNLHLAEAVRYLTTLLREEIAERRKLEVLCAEHAANGLHLEPPIPDEAHYYEDEGNTP